MVFSFSVIKLINILFVSAGIGVSVLCFLQVTASSHLRKEVRRYFQTVLTLIFLYAATHLIRELAEGIVGAGARAVLYTVTFLEILTAGLMAYMFSLLMLSVTMRDRPKRGLVIALSAMVLFHAAILAAGAFGDLIYYFDEYNMYHRGAAYLLSNAGPVAMLAVDIVLLIRYGRIIDRRIRTAFWVYILVPVAAIAVQSFLYGIQFIIIATIGSAVNMFSVILRNQNETYAKQQIERSRIETELSMASGIQADMLPNIYPAFPDRPEFDIYAAMDPAKEVGGDFYDFFLVDDDHLYMVMADVSGKGVPAALFMMASKIILANNAMLGKSPAEILTDTNAAICANNREEMFVTAWLGILELSTGKLVAANAGHEFPVLQGPDGRFNLIKDDHSFVIGGMEDVRYKQYELVMDPGTKLFLYTDGVPEANDGEGKLFGIDRMLAALNESPALTPKEVLEHLRRAVDGFVKDTEQFDDLTMLCLEYTGKKKQ